MTIINRNGLKISNIQPMAAGGSMIIGNFVTIADRLQTNLNYFKTISFVTSPPISANIGDTYLVGTPAVSAFAGHENDVACWSYRYDYPNPQFSPDIVWRFVTPSTGDMLFDLNTQSKYLFRNNQWALTGEGVGTIKIAGYADLPVGWLHCDTTSHAVSAYPRLFAKIGYTHGGSGGMFNVPDLQARVPIGRTVGSMNLDEVGRTLTTRTLGQRGGEEVHLLSTPEMPSHSHTYEQVGGSAPTVGGGGAYDNTSTTNTSTVGGGQVHNNMQPFTVCSYIIKY